MYFLGGLGGGPSPLQKTTYFCKAEGAFPFEKKLRAYGPTFITRYSVCIYIYICIYICLGLVCPRPSGGGG